MDEEYRDSRVLLVSQASMQRPTALAFLALVVGPLVSPAAAQLAVSRPRTCGSSTSTAAEDLPGPARRALLRELPRASSGGSSAIEPAEKITVLLDDFADSGNAGAGGRAANTLTVQIAPLSFAFETDAANERMNTIMNHELVHVAADGPGGAAATASSGGCSAARSLPIAEQPESILYFYLTTPRVRRAALVPRGHRGVRRDLDGRRPRPRAERLRRDGVPRDGARRRAASTTRSAWCPRARRSTSSSRSTRTSTARAS